MLQVSCGELCAGSARALSIAVAREPRGARTSGLHMIAGMQTYTFVVACMRARK